MLKLIYSIHKLELKFRSKSLLKVQFKILNTKVMDLLQGPMRTGLMSGSQEPQLGLFLEKGGVLGCTCRYAVVILLKRNA